MSVLIKGIEMPNDCSECFVKVRECDVIEPLKINERPRDCPLVEVSTPHGRLIDADTLFELLDKTQKEIEADTFGNLHIDYISDEFSDAPTVIEAEE